MNRKTWLKIFVTTALFGAQIVSVQNSAIAVPLVLPAPGLVQVSVGSNSTCAIRAADDLYCAGSNTFGQLGNGNNIGTSEPQKVLGISNVASVSVGTTSACAVTTNGNLYCWGENTNGQLGIGNKENKNLPTLVSGLVNIVAVSVGTNFACALSNTGVVSCWGGNDVGQLTNASKQDSTTPQITSLTPSGISSLNASGKRVCVLATEVYCWGEFESFIFPSETRNWIPTKVTGSSGASSVTLGGNFGCLTFPNSVSCWGANEHGQLGNGTREQSAQLVPVSNITSVKKLAAGDHFACTIDANGDSFCWGENSSGQLGVSTKVDQLTRIPTGAAASIAIDAGLNTFCALTALGNIACLGDNSSGQSGYLLSSPSPLAISAWDPMSKVSTGSNTTCALTSAGAIKCWGTLVPVIPKGLSFSDVSVGSSSACVVTTAKKVMCWGSNSSGQLGDNSNRSATTMVELSSTNLNFTRVAVGSRHACAVTSDGLVYCWGDNSRLQLGSTGADTKIPKSVPGIGDAIGLAVGDNHNCIQRSGGDITCWGDNSKKQISSASSTTLTPTDMSVKAVTNFALGSYNTCLLNAAKTLQCLGDNSKKQSPSSIAGTYVGVSASANTVCAINTDSNVFCFGAADSSKLGSTTVDSALPIQIAGATAVSVSVGSQHACLISSTGRLSCWGSNSSGQLGSSFGFPSAFDDISVAITGRLAVGETLVPVVTSREATATYSYVWKRATASNGPFAVLASQTDPNLTSSSNDLGRWFAVEVKQTKWGITSSSYLSEAVGPISPAIRLLNTPTPTLSGSNRVGKYQIANAGQWDSGTTLTFQWYRGSSVIKGANRSMYQLTKADVGKQISVSVTGFKIGLPKIVKKSLKTAKILR